MGQSHTNNNATHSGPKHISHSTTEGYEQYIVDGCITCDSLKEKLGARFPGQRILYYDTTL